MSNPDLKSNNYVYFVPTKKEGKNEIVQATSTEIQLHMAVEMFVLGSNGCGPFELQSSFVGHKRKTSLNRSPNKGDQHGSDVPWMVPDDDRVLRR
ncbi:unnamed protein product [Camellia sinensis]